MDYKGCLEVLFRARSCGAKRGLEPMLKTLQHFQNPQKAFPVVHVAGTNGKGSVTTKIAAGLQRAGYRVGRFTSPHITSFCERISINGTNISEEEVVCLCKRLFAFEHTFFEYATLMAFLHFAQNKVDVAVLEVGLGGRLDATNVCESSLSVITSISLDHTQILGNTLEEIVREKAGIIRPGVPVVIGPHVPKEVIAEKADTLYVVEGSFVNFELENQAIAKKALEVLGVPEEARDEGIKEVPPCRFQKIERPGMPLVIADVAHNPDGIKRLFERVRLEYPATPLCVVAGFSEDKDVAGCLATIVEHADALFCVPTQSERGMRANALKALAERGTTKAVIAYEKIEEGMAAAQAVAKKRGALVVVCGSFYIMEPLFSLKVTPS